MTRPLFPVFAVPHCVPLPEAARLRSTYAAQRFRLSARPRQRWVTDSKGGRALVWVSMIPAAEALAEARAIVAAGGYEFGPRFAAGFGSNRAAEGGGLFVENPEAARVRALCESYLESRADSRDKRAETRLGRYGMGSRRFPPGLSAMQEAWAEGYSSGAY